MYKGLTYLSSFIFIAVTIAKSVMCFSTPLVVSTPCPHGSISCIDEKNDSEHKVFGALTQYVPFLESANKYGFASMLVLKPAYRKYNTPFIRAPNGGNSPTYIPLSSNLIKLSRYFLLPSALFPGLLSAMYRARKPLEELDLTHVVEL